MKVWRVQKTTDKPGGLTRPYGAVSRSWGFNDSPDAEILVAGYNTGKENGAVAVGRHGNFLQWGFSAPPSKMTDAGREFFVNCICYIAKFNGKAPLVRVKSGDRFEALRSAMAISYVKKPNVFWKSFPPELKMRYGSDWKGLVKYFQDRYELVFLDSAWVFHIDHELESLGLQSNRKMETLDKLIALLNDRDKADVAKKLLGRYTLESFETANEWQEWMKKNRDHIYFTDVGGYKFRLVPEGYLDEKAN